tara:strand:+ start:250 stop:411 length:162 start_codon:yes stop_codon:yes gene_type:complete
MFLVFLLLFWFRYPTQTPIAAMLGDGAACIRLHWFAMIGVRYIARMFRAKRLL